MNKKILYIDPNSYSNMEIYGRELLNHVDDFEKYFWGHNDFKTNRTDSFKYYKAYSYNKKRNKFYQLFSYILSQVRLFFIIIKIKPDIIHIQWLKVYTFDVYFYKFIKHFFRLKLVYTIHNILPHDTDNKHKQVFLKMYKCVDTIIIHSLNSKTEFKELFNIDTPVFVIEHGLLNYNIPHDSLNHLKSEFSKQFSINKNNTIFLMIGKILKYKGFDLVIKSWLNSDLYKNQNLKLIIAGNGNIPELKDINSVKNIFLINRFLKEEEFISLIHLSDAILLPYRKISQSGILSVILNEMKTPIVSKIGGLTDVFNVGKVGTYFDSLDCKDIITSLNYFIENQEQFNKQNTIKEWKKIHTHFGWTRIGKLTNDLYNNVLNMKDE